MGRLTPVKPINVQNFLCPWKCPHLCCPLAGHEPSGATEHWQCGNWDWETEFFILIRLHLNSHTWLVAAIVDNTALDGTTELHGIHNTGNANLRLKTNDPVSSAKYCKRGTRDERGTYRLKQTQVTYPPGTLGGSGICFQKVEDSEPE